MSKHYECDVCRKPIPTLTDFGEGTWLLEKGVGLKLEMWGQFNAILNPENCLQLCSFDCAKEIIAAFISDEEDRMKRYREHLQSA